MRKYIIAVLLIAGSASQALSQATSLTEADKSFLIKDRRGATYELESAKLAAAKSSGADVRRYAEKLIHDHETYNAALETLGKAEGLVLPTEPDAADQAHMQDLRKLSGAAFDDLYIQEALRINADDKRDAEKEKTMTQVPAIRDFIGKFASMDAEHEALAKRLQASKG